LQKQERCTKNERPVGPQPLTYVHTNTGCSPRCHSITLRDATGIPWTSHSSWLLSLLRENELLLRGLPRCSSREQWYTGLISGRVTRNRAR